ncbi:MAG: hypothetical protein MZV63_35445 [Marinilabiliales bacterium]|nr:hypothetical protein [Marinilabiliales bacterium]
MTETTDINGSFCEIIVGGFSDININDTEGPVIRLFMNDTLFRDGGITDTSLTSWRSSVMNQASMPQGPASGMISSPGLMMICQGQWYLTACSGQTSENTPQGALTYPFVITGKG